MFADSASTRLKRYFTFATAFDTAVRPITQEFKIASWLSGGCDGILENGKRYNTVQSKLTKKMRCLHEETTKAHETFSNRPCHSGREKKRSAFEKSKISYKMQTNKNTAKA